MKITSIATYVYLVVLAALSFLGVFKFTGLPDSLESRVKLADAAERSGDNDRVMPPKKES
jgi:thiol:disulfide interchange protein